MNKLGRPSRRTIVWLALALLLAAVACNMPGCGARPQGVEEAETPLPPPSPTVDVSKLPPTAPKVVASRPLVGEELPLDGSIDIYFDQPMDKESVEAALKVEPSISGEITWIDDSTLRFEPAPGALDRAAEYTVTIGEGAKAANGLALEVPEDIDVQTVGFLEVSEVVPAPGSDAVAPDAAITVLFNRPVVPLGIAEDMGDLPQPLVISPDAPGEGEWINTSIYMWKPSRPLAGGTTYTVSIEAGLEDQTGGLLEETYTWEFTTLPPDVVSVEPAESDIPLDAPVVVEFNQPMDQLSVQGAFSLTDEAGGSVAGTFAWNEGSTEMTFTPSGLLAMNTTYTGTIAANALGAGGQTSLGQDVTWTFVTVPPPSVSGTNPPQGTTDASNWGGFSFFFSAPMDEDSLTEELIVADPPLPEDVNFYYSSYDHSWNVNTQLEPSTTYTITLMPGAADPYGHTIDAPYVLSFATQPLPPMVQFNTVGQFGLYDANRTTELFTLYRNVSSVSFELSELPADEFGRLTGPDGYQALQSYTPTQDRVLRRWSIPAEGALNEAVYARVPVVAEEGGSLEPGIYLLTATAPELDEPIRHFMLVVTANLTLKTSFDEALVWMTDLETGEPVNGVGVALFDQNFNQIGSGETDAEGVTTIAHPHRDNLWDLEYAVAAGNGHFAIAMNQWDQGVSPWEFGDIPTQFQAQDYSLYVYTDRPLYRPGQEVYFKGVLRQESDARYSLPSGGQVQVTVYNDQGDVIQENSLPLSDYGTFDGTIALDQEASLGYYNIQVTFGPMTIGQGFQVAEYRRPEFAVNLEPEADQVVAGDEINVTVDAEFYFGGPVSNAQVEWTVLSDQYIFAPDVPGNYSFYDTSQDQRYGQDFVPGFGEVIADGTGTTDADGKFVITLPASLDDTDTSRRFTVEATVTDINEQSVSGRTEVIVHKGEYYAGVWPDEYVVSAGDEVTASLIALDWNGKPVKGQDITVELVQEEWNSVREEDEFGRTQWTWSLEETVIGEPVTVTTDGQGKATVTLTPPEAGSYKIRASVTDPAGNTQRGSAFVWVSGNQFVAWRQANNNRIEVVADQDTYEPGDTAKILIASPFQGNDVQALVTVERGGVLSHEVFTLQSNSEVYELPINGSHAPNVYVSVVLVKGVDDTNPVPTFRMGLVKLNVAPVEQTIDLSVTPDRDMVGPREEVTYTVEATDYQGNPVDAEVSLALVDLATLSLAPPNSGPITDHFYGSAALGVKTSVPMIFLVDRLNQELFDQGKGGGGGGGEGFFDVRTEFEDTAYWNASIRTGDDGTAEVSITLPDNLTTWRMDARAVTQNTLVGQAQVDIVASKPLLIRPNTPRFFVVGDDATLTAVVNNNTEENIDAAVSLDAEGVTLQGAAQQTVSIPAGGRVEVNWPVTVGQDAEWVDLVFRAEGGGLQDASKPPLGDPNHEQMLPVLRFDVPETVGTAGQLAEAGTRVEGVVLPPTYDVQAGRLDVRIDPSLAAATVDGLDWLEHYEYECTEQTVSRFLPNALTLRAYREFNLSDAELEQNLQEQLDIGLQRLYSQQHVDGGWGWWITSPSNATVTAYVVQGLLAAQDAGYTVEPRVLSDGLAYLRDQLEPLTTISAQYGLHQQAYILYVLAEAGQPDVSRTVQLYEARQGMQHWAQALTAQALWLIDPNDSRIDNIQSDLANAAILSATGAHWEEEAPDHWNWNTDTRSTAIILDTYARVWPDSDLAPNIVRWLMIAREGSHWETTQETAWALIGLTRWMQASGELSPNYTWTFEFNGQERADGTASPSNVRESTLITIDVTEMLRDEVNRLTFTREAGDGRLYYTAHLTAYLPVEEVDPLSRGIIVNRRYLNENGTVVTNGQVGDTVTVELTIVAPHDLYYVVVEDPYPAGAEAVNVDLLTESVLGERPTLQPDDPLAQGWGWWWFSQTDLRDEKAVMFADYLPAGTYQYTYQLRLGIAGEYQVIPPVAQEFYLPEVYGRGAGSLFMIRP